VLGKFAPNNLLGFMGMGAGYYSGDLQGAAGMAALGALGRGGATLSTTRRAKLASELARGGTAPKLLKTDPVVRALLAGQGAQ
jgi:hypothetical protein